MADTTKISNSAAATEAVALASELDNGYLRIYDSTGGTGQPATVDTAIGSQVLLAELRFSATAESSTTNGVITFAAITADSSANATGTATWFRAFKSDGTTAIWDGSVGTSGATINLNTTSIVAGANVSVTSLTFTINKG
jgi:hypothetical protein